MSYGTVPLTKDQENDVLNRIGYSTAQLKADVVQLRRWLNKQEHLPACRLKETDAFLSTFLTGSKGSIERSKRRIDAYYTFRGRNNIFTGRTDPSYLERALKISGAAELRRRDSTTSVVFVSLTDVDPEHFDGIDAMKAFLLYFEYKFRMGSGIQGSQIYLVDFKNYSTSHLLRLPPAELKSFIEFFHEVYPIRIDKIIIANVHPLLTAAMNAIVTTTNPKIKSRITVTSLPLEKVFDDVEMLPSEYEGGQEKSIRSFCDSTITKYLEDLKDVIPNLDDTVDEAKRLNVDRDVFSIQGTFKSLVID